MERFYRTTLIVAVASSLAILLYSTRPWEDKLSRKSAASYQIESYENQLELVKTSPTKHAATIKEDQPDSRAQRLPNKKARHPVKVLYPDYSHCPRPQYLTEYKANCWMENGQRFCVPNLLLLGIRKCGTTDIFQWMAGHSKNGSPLKVIMNDYPGAVTSCPTQKFATAPAKLRPNLRPEENLYIDGPGLLLVNTRLKTNATHITVQPVVQALGFMNSPKTKYMVQLRNPTDRAISYIFHWHRMGSIYKNIPHTSFDGHFVDKIMRDLLSRLQKDIEDQGELAAYYSTDGKDGNMALLLPSSMYVVFLEEAWKFIPKSQVIFTTIAEYSKDEAGTMRKIFNHFGLEFNESIAQRQSQQTANIGRKNPVMDSTIQMLDDFYEPYNRRLCTALGDEKFLFKRN